ncbi:type II toxin-antitoxin system HicB family antitoxin [Rhizobium leguminosarum]|jgi:predicted RNase H-like HicB family nuclease
MAEQIRVIVLQDDGVFVAQCLEVDIAAQGKTAEEAMARLKLAFNAEVREAKESGRSLMDIGPAPEAFAMMYGSKVVERTALVA